LRIGYVSADFYHHPVGWLGCGPIIAHDRSAVTVFAYANQTSHDQLTDRLKRSVDAWVPIMGLDDDTVASRIAADRPHGGQPACRVREAAGAGPGHLAWL
jgi:predicted O-linked N-acetylglucosamine transferase (SPINDLY family)